MKLTILSFLFVAMSATVACAQISYAPEIGILLSNYTGKSDGAALATTVKTGATGGLVVNIELGKGNFYVQPGLLYLRNGANEGKPVTTGSISVNTFELPVNIIFKLGASHKDGFYVGVGPYVAINASGYQKSDAANANGNIALQFGSNPSTDALQSRDLGFGVRAGYGLISGISIDLHYQMSLVNLEPGGNAQNTVQSVNYGVTIGYALGDKQPKKQAKKDDEDE